MNWISRDWIAKRERRQLWIGLSAVFLLTTGWIVAMDRALVTPTAPHGIVSFELAGDFVSAEAILDSWSPSVKKVALKIQRFDFFYLVVYPAWLSLTVAILSVHLGGFWLRLGGPISWLVWGAAPLDAVENHALIQQLLDGPSQHFARLACWCAVPKFALVLLAVVFLLGAGGTWFFRRQFGQA